MPFRLLLAAAPLVRRLVKLSISSDSGDDDTVQDSSIVNLFLINNSSGRETNWRNKIISCETLFMSLYVDSLKKSCFFFFAVYTFKTISYSSPNHFWIKFNYQKKNNHQISQKCLKMFFYHIHWLWSSRKIIPLGSGQILVGFRWMCRFRVLNIVSRVWFRGPKGL